MIEKLGYGNEYYNIPHQIDNIIKCSTEELIKDIMFLVDINDKLKPSLEKINKKYFL